MQEYRTLGATETRQILLGDKKVNTFLNYLGLFPREMRNSLKSGGFTLKTFNYYKLFPHKDAEALSQKIAGEQFKLSVTANYTRKVRPKIVYPGESVYFIGDLFGEFSGYPRIIYEVLDSSVRYNPVNILAFIVQNENSNISGIRKFFPTDNGTLERCFRKLSNLGFINFDGEKFIATEISRKIFSPKVRDVWEELKKWEHRIDVWQ